MLSRQPLLFQHGRFRPHSGIQSTFSWHSSSSEWLSIVISHRTARARLGVGRTMVLPARISVRKPVLSFLLWLMLNRSRTSSPNFGADCERVFLEIRALSDGEVKDLPATTEIGVVFASICFFVYPAPGGCVRSASVQEGMSAGIGWHARCGRILNSMGSIPPRLGFCLESTPFLFGWSWLRDHVTTVWHWFRGAEMSTWPMLTRIGQIESEIG